jgi:YD repeat-containing protein
MRALSLVALVAGCWQTSPPVASQPAKPVAPPKHPEVCPLIARMTPFEFVRHELFSGCSPPQFLDAPEVHCHGTCATPCGAKLDSTLTARLTNPTGLVFIAYEQGRYIGQRESHGLVRECSYDARGRMTTCTHNGTIFEEYTRDAAGRLVKLEAGAWDVAIGYDARGDIAQIDIGYEAIKLHYDDARRLVAEERFIGTEMKATYTYDYDRNLLRTIQLDEDGSITYSYRGDRLVKTDEKRHDLDRVTHYRYDTAGRPLSTSSRIDRRDKLQPPELVDVEYRYSCD